MSFTAMTRFHAEYCTVQLAIISPLHSQRQILSISLVVLLGSVAQLLILAPLPTIDVLWSAHGGRGDRSLMATWKLSLAGRISTDKNAQM